MKQDITGFIVERQITQAECIAAARLLRAKYTFAMEWCAMARSLSTTMCAARSCAVPALVLLAVAAPPLYLLTGRSSPA